MGSDSIDIKVINVCRWLRLYFGIKGRHFWQQQY